MELKKKKIWFITGISRGLGKALAEAALLRGDTVIGTSRSGTADIQHNSGRLHVFSLDVTDREQVFATVNAAYELYWRLDVVVNNLGDGLLGEMEETSPEEFNHVMDVNLFSTVHVMQAVLPIFRDQQSGQIVNLSSIAFERASECMRQFEHELDTWKELALSTDYGHVVAH